MRKADKKQGVGGEGVEKTASYFLYPKPYTLIVMRGGESLTIHNK